MRIRGRAGERFLVIVVRAEHLNVRTKPTTNSLTSCWNPCTMDVATTIKADGHPDGRNAHHRPRPRGRRRFGAERLAIFGKVKLGIVYALPNYVVTLVCEENPHNIDGIGNRLLYFASRDSLVVDSLNGVLHVAERTAPPLPVRLGNENIKAVYEACSRARVAVVANQTSVIGDGRKGESVHLVDTLLALGIDVRKVFAPEHGFRGDAHNGANIDDSVDPKTGLPILSLHGKHRKPTAESLDDVRVIIFDIQDVGARFYTYLAHFSLSWKPPRKTTRW